MSTLLRCAAAILLLAFAITCQAAPDTPDGNRTLVVGVKIAPPFVTRNGEHYDGLAVHLWQEVASDHGWHYVYRPYALDDLLDAVAAGKVDVGLGAITATAKREQRMDFAHTITSSGLGVAVRDQDRAGWVAVARALLSPAFLSVISALALLLFVVGFAAWLLERKRNVEQFGEGRARGIFSGFWWALVTMTTVGYGDVAPRTVPGRLLAMVWMLSALLITSFFTASITSALTVGQLSSRIRNADDLARVNVCSVPHSTSAQWLARRRIDFDGLPTLDAALQELARGGCDAVVYDKPLLHWQIGRHFHGKLSVLPLTLARQDYAFVLPHGSPLREAIDTSLLQRINAPDWSRRVERYLGDDTP